LDDQPPLGRPRGGEGEASGGHARGPFHRGQCDQRHPGHPPAGIVARAICPVAAAAATCGTAVWFSRSSTTVVPELACTSPPRTTACPTGSAGDELPCEDEPAADAAGVASTSTVCPADRSGGYWPTLTATPSSSCPAAGAAAPMSPDVSRAPAGSG